MQFKNIRYSVSDNIATITIARGKANATVPELYAELAYAFLEAEKDPAVVVTYLTGAGRFFSAGADVDALASDNFAHLKNDPTGMYLAQSAKFAGAVELQRAMIEHPKLFVIGLNGPAVGVACAWTGYPDILLASSSAYISGPFSALGLSPESGSHQMFRESMGSRLANEALIFGKKLGAQEMRKAGFVSHVFPDATFQSDAIKFLKEQLEVNDFTSMLEAKRLILAPLLDSRLVANTRWHTAVARDFASGRPEARVQAQVAKLAAKKKPAKL